MMNFLFKNFNETIMYCFKNVYKDEKGEYLGDEEYDDYDTAFKMRDDLPNVYKETVIIIRCIKSNKEAQEIQTVLSLF